MKNKKIIITAVIIITICAVLFGIFRTFFNSNYLYDENGHISHGDIENVLEYVNGIDDKEKRAYLINSLVERKILTQKEANEL